MEIIVLFLSLCCNIFVSALRIHNTYVHSVMHVYLIDELTFNRGHLIYLLTYFEGHAVAKWLRHCATNRMVAGSIPDGVRIFH
jgi:hypothetical protein